MFPYWIGHFFITIPSIWQDIDQTSTRINRDKVQIETGQKMIEKLKKGIEETKVEKERLMGEKEKLRSTSKETEEKAIAVMENCAKIQDVSNHFFCLYVQIFTQMIIKSRMTKEKACLTNW